MEFMHQFIKNKSLNFEIKKKAIKLSSSQNTLLFD